MMKWLVIGLIACSFVLVSCGDENIPVEGAEDVATQQLSTNTQKATPQPKAEDVSGTGTQITQISQNVMKTVKENIAIEMVQFATQAVTEEI